MITAFSQNDVNDINQVLSDENFTRNEMYIISNALETYYRLKFNQNSLKTCEKIQEIKNKIDSLIQVDLENE